MFSWFFNLFRRGSYEERLKDMCRREHDSAGRDIKRTPDTPDEFEPLEWSDELPIIRRPAGKTADGVYYGFIGDSQVGGAQEINPPYRTFLFAPEKQLPNRKVTKHEYGHKHLIIRLNIKNHDKRYDWCFWLWAYSRKMTDRVLATLRHPLSERTTFRAIERDGLLIDEITEE